MDKFENFLLEMPMQTGNDLGLIAQDPKDPNLLVLIKNIPGLQLALKNYDYDVIENCVFGVMMTRHNTMYRAIEVDKVWARPGFGPLLYYIAMTYAGADGLMSTRVAKQVSDKAKGVWANFAGSGKVRAVPIETDSPHHPENYLMQKYVLLEPVNVDPYLKRAKSIIGRDPYGEKETTIIEVAEGLLGGEMNKVYGGD